MRWEIRFKPFLGDNANISQLFECNSVYNAEAASTLTIDLALMTIHLGIFEVEKKNE